MMKKDIDVKGAIYELVALKGPINWRGIEIRLRIPRSGFQDDYTLMTYLNEMTSEGKLLKLDDGKYTTPAPSSADALNAHE